MYYLPIIEYIHNWHGANYISIVKYLGDINFIDYFTKNNLNDCLEVFYGHINYIIDHFIPKIQKHDFKFPIWFSKELRCLIKQNKIAHDLYKHSNDLKNYFEFSKLRSKCKHIRHRDYSLYTVNSQREIKNNPKFFWKFVNDNSTNNHKLPNVMSYLNKEADNEKDIIHLFKDYFSDTYVSNNNTYPQSVVEENNLTPISKI